MAKRKSTAKFKGVQYIAQRLRKYSPGKFKNYNDALTRAREVKQQLDSTGSRVTVKNIMSLVRTKRVPKTELSLPESLTDVSQYFEINKYTGIIIREVDAKITFISKLFPAELEPLQGQHFADYEEYLAPFVRYIDHMRSLLPDAERQTPYPWNVRCLPPDTTGVSKIISCDSDGNEEDFGFNPADPNFQPQSVTQVSTKGKSQQGISKIPSKTNDVDSVDTLNARTRQIEAELKLEQQKEKTNKSKAILEAMNMLKSKLITKAEFKEIISKL